MSSFADCICKNIDVLADAARRGDQGYVNQYLDTLWMFHERRWGRSGLEPRPVNETNNRPAEQKSLFERAA